MVRIIMACITSCKLNVPWNGEKTEDFVPIRGIRQGDPLSHYLFTMCMERLSHLIDVEVSSKNWKGIRASRNGPCLSHLFFVDDLILFGEASVQQATLIKNCLDVFCNASGQKVSNAKSKVYFSPNTCDVLKGQIVSELAIFEIDDLGIYLGMPTINGKVTKATFQSTMDKVDKRLTGWKVHTLSLAGRTTLIQSTLSTIPSYAMQTVRLPLTFYDDLDKKAMSFL